jgi:hypothetical protein
VVDSLHPSYVDYPALCDIPQNRGSTQESESECRGSVVSQRPSGHSLRVPRLKMREERHAETVGTWRYDFLGRANLDVSAHTSSDIRTNSAICAGGITYGSRRSLSS